MFLYSLSQIVYDHEDHHGEMKVRQIVEVVRYVDHYLDHEYLCREYEFPYERENTQEVDTAHIGLITFKAWM